VRGGGVRKVRKLYKGGGRWQCLAGTGSEDDEAFRVLGPCGGREGADAEALAPQAHQTMGHVGGLGDTSKRNAA
jgi:hypothetical protein